MGVSGRAPLDGRPAARASTRARAASGRGTAAGTGTAPCRPPRPDRRWRAPRRRRRGTRPASPAAHPRGVGAQRRGLGEGPDRVPLVHRGEGLEVLGLPDRQGAQRRQQPVVGGGRRHRRDPALVVLPGSGRGTCPRRSRGSGGARARRTGAASARRACRPGASAAGEARQQARVVGQPLQRGVREDQAPGGASGAQWAMSARWVAS